MKGPARLVIALLATAAALPLVPVQAMPEGAVGSAAASSTWFERGTTMSPRLQWNANDGYCGETSFISAGMAVGQYTSQWTARALASPDVPQTRASSQLLLGANDLAAARRMRLDARAFPTDRIPGTAAFLVWVKRHFLAGNQVIIGVNNNVRELNEPLPGEKDSYDHIVPVFGIGSHRSLARSSDDYLVSDTITISDNGLHNIGQNYPFLYTYRFDEFPMSRRAANRLGGPLYSLDAGTHHYGTAVTGVLDPTRVTIPVRLTSNVRGEGLQNQSALADPPPARPITLTAHVTIPDASHSYDVYLYDDFAKVPVRDFSAHSGTAIRAWHIPAGVGSAWTVTIRALSSDTRVFRAVQNGG